MLEFLGFIALIAIIFGISFGAALSGFIKVILIGVCILAILGILIKMLDSEKGSLFVLLASVGAICFGVYLINDNYDRRASFCDSMKQWIAPYSDCLLNAMDGHNNAVNLGWGYAITGAITGLISLAAYGEKSSDKKHTTKK